MAVAPQVPLKRSRYLGTDNNRGYASIRSGECRDRFPEWRAGHVEQLMVTIEELLFSSASAQSHRLLRRLSEQQATELLMADFQIMTFPDISKLVPGSCCFNLLLNLRQIRKFLFVPGERSRHSLPSIQSQVFELIAGV